MAEPIDIPGAPKEEPPKKSSGARRARTSTPPPADDAPKRRTPQDRKLAEAIADTYRFVGITVTGVGMNAHDAGLADTGVAIVNGADGVSDAWLDLADKNPKVKAALRRFTEASATGVLVAMHVSMAMPLLASRGVLPTSMFGAPNQNGHGASAPSNN